jgi:hypothetical protein
VSLSGPPVKPNRDWREVLLKVQQLLIERGLEATLHDLRRYDETEGYTATADLTVNRHVWAIGFGLREAGGHAVRRSRHEYLDFTNAESLYNLIAGDRVLAYTLERLDRAAC